ncbi:MAG: hypothetical protein V1792_18745 [Pseudomonadota bacterium]
MLDLWPNSLDSLPLDRAPVTILREQASLLGRKTNNLLEGEVIQIEPFDAADPEFTYRFNIVAPALGNYRYGLFMIFHAITLYPVRFRVDEDVRTELAVGVESQGRIPVAEDETQFVDILRQILASTKTQRVIAGLLTQMRGSNGMVPAGSA